MANTVHDRPDTALSYGGMVINQAAAGEPAVRALVYVAAVAPDPGESALLLSGKFEGSTLGGALEAYPVASGGHEFRIAADTFHHQFCADLDAGEAALMAERAGSRGTREIAGASHAIAASQPDAVTAAILEAAGHVRD